MNFISEATLPRGVSIICCISSSSRYNPPSASIVWHGTKFCLQLHKGILFLHLDLHKVVTKIELIIKTEPVQKINQFCLKFHGHNVSLNSYHGFTVAGVHLGSCFSSGQKCISEANFQMSLLITMYWCAFHSTHPAPPWEEAEFRDALWVWLMGTNSLWKCWLPGLHCSSSKTTQLVIE